jgi:hypothetical protein
MGYFKSMMIEVKENEMETINNKIKEIATNFILSNQDEITIVELVSLLKEVENKLLNKELKEFFLNEYEIVYENDFEYCYVGYNVKSFMENEIFQSELKDYLDIFYGILENKIKIEEKTIFIYPVEK